MTEENRKKIAAEDKYKLLLLATQLQSLNLQIQLMQQNMLTAQQEIAKKQQELADFRAEIANKYGVDLSKETLDPKTDEFVPLPANVPFQLQVPPQTSEGEG